MRRILLAGGGFALCGLASPALAADDPATIAALQRQIDELRAQVQALIALQAARQDPAAPPPAAVAAVTAPAATPASPAPAASPATATLASATVSPVPAATKPAKPKAWYDRLQLRGYTQLRVNEVLAGDTDSPAGISRLRSVQDSGVGEKGNFTFRRIRLALQGDVSERMGLYLQGEFASAVTGQANGERRENFFQLRDAYADVYFADRTIRLRVGQSKVPFGWENLQSSSNRITLDRADGPNSAVPGERDIGIVGYYTPPKIQAIWDHLAKDGQKLFGNYGAFGLGVFNGQGTNRTEKNDGLMKVAMATVPFKLDGLGGLFRGQVLELGAEGMINTFHPEVRTGGVSAQAVTDNRVNLHAILYPAPFGLQAEWSWGKGPEWDPLTRAVTARPLNGGYVQAMYRIKHSPIGSLIPYARWQSYRGGWKTATNAPRISTDEVELGVEWLPLKEFEVTMAYARMRRSEADERRSGVARGDLLRAQLQWNY
ncbi:porin [Novosphingobium piscinae]|uniref:Porin n=1 Tax=Novosphingobium piscinae TaxID=1507448 RepID=A0A7X1G0A5_9SPHN|nr:porin [Novosphingobium piscinae]MBC2670134.1 porin [Novosphingobium piscinae]